ncbi:MAG TPA: hypothetical protein VGR78_19560 [Verrucomicrobiae bacterium]|jgi:hypothetical protein|nr:hypothetical protein [Verrucomicrobiae bacterium]
MNPSVIFPIVLTALIAWRIYRRVRRSIGRQRLQIRRVIISIIMFSVFTVLMAFFSSRYPAVLAGFGGGVAAGTVLGMIGIRLTRFETSAEGRFYTPSARIGVALAFLLAGRMLYRMTLLQSGAYASNNARAMQSPLTFLIAGLTFGYYLTFSIGLLIRSRNTGAPSAPLNA